VNIAVYSRPECVQCDYTKKLLDGIPLSYTEFDIDADPAARKMVEDSGKTQLPMVVAGDQVWHGFKPAKIRALKSV
jgi:glutaredoxin-like protein NrdH